MMTSRASSCFPGRLRSPGSATLRCRSWRSWGFEFDRVVEHRLEFRVISPIRQPLSEITKAPQYFFFQFGSFDPPSSIKAIPRLPWPRHTLEPGRKKRARRIDLTGHKSRDRLARCLPWERSLIEIFSLCLWFLKESFPSPTSKEHRRARKVLRTGLESS